ncbi:uncharacterized protein LOC142325347 [Lycorma delicatula]|uniref:uncharacterized protein LOC142325347 n=1 Tax=Lycorma delicatula TaxID=130591 RepID=UPI003F514B0D
MTYSRRHDSFSSAKWWLSAGCCALIVTLSFVGVTLWLGMNNVRQEQSQHLFRDYHRQNNKILSSYITVTASPSTLLKQKSETEPPVLDQSSEQRFHERPFKTSNRGKIEMVRPSDILTPKIQEPPTRIGIPLPEAIPSVQNEAVKQTVEERKYDGDLETKQNKPIESDLDDSFSTAVDKSPSEKSSTKKKSEAVFPDWFDPDLIGSVPVIEQKQEEDLKQEFYNKPPQIPDFNYIREIPAPFQYNQENEDDDDNNNIIERENPTKENPLFGFLRKRVQDLYDWLSKGGVNSKQEWMQLLNAVNQSINEKNVTAVVTKLKEMYNQTIDDIEDVPVSSIIYPSDPGLNPISFGLLAIDLFLLHNVQQIAWSEKRSEGEKMLQDPDILALNALFLPPDGINQLRSTGKTTSALPRNGQNFMQDLLELLSGGLRAVLNLGRAYAHSEEYSRSQKYSPLDCVWTLYCRNLEKTARMEGPYGFLAKMNRLGLRLLMGEFPVENALDHLIKEATQGWQEIECDKLFPRCTAEEAKNIVLEAALGSTPITTATESTTTMK